jgi:hypothetical protein
MALRDQPYLPLYVQDFLTDEKLVECSAAATGVYIRLMCIMHKSEHYGKILLKQKHKQTSEQIKNFALMIAKQMPYDTNVIFDSLKELVDENVLYIEGDFLLQKRMVKDCDTSLKRSSAGQSGGKKTQEKTKHFASHFAKAKTQANTENEIEITNEDVFVVEDVVKKEKKTREKFIAPTIQEVHDFAEKEMNGSKDAPDNFFNYYEARGWMMQKTPMKNWKAAYKNWTKNEKQYEAVKGTNQHRAETKTEQNDRLYRDFGKELTGGKPLPDIFELCRDSEIKR